MYWIGKFILWTMNIVSNLVSKALILLIIHFFLGIGLTMLPEAKNYPLTQKVIDSDAKLRAPVMSLMHANLPLKFEGFDAAPWVYITAVFILLVSVELYRDFVFERRELLAIKRQEHLERRAKEKDEKKREKERKAAAAKLEKEAAERAKRGPGPITQRRTAEEIAQARLLAESAGKARAEAEAKARVESEARAQLEQKLKAEEEARAKAEAELKARAAQAPQLNPNNREDLLELLAQTKKSLDGQKRLLAFLAMDVVNSTGMKQGEEPSIAERDFRQYKRFVEQTIAEHGYLKAAWTPDGQMVCFPSAESAVKAAQAILLGLDHFNKNVKAMKTDFRIRAGINAGRVSYDEQTPMQEMADRVIDIAGHMQKYAAPDSIFINASALADGGAALGFHAIDKVIDECQVLQWQSPSAADDTVAA